MVLIDFPIRNRSREWVCPKCKQSNLECLPDPPAVPSSSGSSSQSDSSSSHSHSLGSTAPSTPPTDGLTKKESPRDEFPSGPPQPEQQQPSDASACTVPLVAPTPTRPLRPSSIITRNEPLPAEPAKPRSPDQAPERERQAPPVPVHPENFQPTLAAALRQSPRRPPLLLDTAICVLLVLLCALIYRRLV